MAKLDDVIAESPFTARYRDSFYAPYGSLNAESAALIMRVAALEHCSAPLLAHAWMNESSFRFYPPPNTNQQTDPVTWDYGPMQMNLRVYRENVRVKWISPLPEADVFGRMEDVVDGPVAFTGNPLMNLRAGASYLTRIRGDWRVEKFLTLDAMKAGKFTGGTRVLHRANNWLEWESVLTDLFNKLADV